MKKLKAAVFLLIDILFGLIILAILLLIYAMFIPLGYIYNLLNRKSIDEKPVILSYYTNSMNWVVEKGVKDIFFESAHLCGFCRPVVLFYPGEETFHTDYKGVQIYELKNSAIILKKSGLRLSYYALNTLIYILYEFYIIFSHSVDCLFTNDMFFGGVMSILVGRVVHVPVVLGDVMGIDFKRRTGYILGSKKMSDMVTRFCIRYATGIFVYESFQKDVFLNIVNTNPEKFKKVIYRVFLNHFEGLNSSPTDKRDLGWDGKFVFFSQTRFNYEKYIYQLVIAFSELPKIYPNVLLCLLGRGPEKEKYVDLINKYDLSSYVKLYDFVPMSKLGKYLCASDVHVHLTGGAVVLESGMAEKPVICYKTNCFDQEVVHNLVTGLKAEFENIAALRDCLIYTIEHPKDMVVMGKALKKEVMEKKNLKVYYDLTSIAFSDIIKAYYSHKQ